MTIFCLSLIIGLLCLAVIELCKGYNRVYGLLIMLAGLLIALIPYLKGV